MPKICLLSLCSRLISDESSIDSYSSSWTDLSLGLHFPFKSLTRLHANNTNVSIMVGIRSREETTCFIPVILLVSSAFNNGITAMTARIVRYTDSNALTLFFLYGCNVLWMARISEQIINRMTWKNRRKLWEINVFNVALLDSAHVKCDVWTGPQRYVFPGALALHYQLAIGLQPFIFYLRGLVGRLRLRVFSLLTLSVYVWVQELLKCYSIGVMCFYAP